jgi:hypothetical protein
MKAQVASSLPQGLQSQHRLTKRHLYPLDTVTTNADEAQQENDDPPKPTPDVTTEEICRHQHLEVATNERP